MQTFLLYILPCLLCGLLLGFLAGFGLLRFSFWRLYFKGASAGVPVSFSRLLHMYLGRIRIEPIYNAYFTLKSHGLPADVDAISAHVLAGGDAMGVAAATAAAHKAGLKVTFEQLCAFDLAGGDAMGKVQRQIEGSIFHSDQEWQGIRVGHQGRAVTNIGMAGQATIEGQKVRVISTKGLVPAGCDVRVLAVDGSVLTVEGIGVGGN